ncbi:MAG: hypothetical protein ABFD79_12680 [Phycisphaerales bacterium]
MDFENNEYGFITIRQRLLNCWDDKFASLLFEKAQAPGIKVKPKQNLFNYLFEHKYLPAIEYAKNFVKEPMPLADSSYELYIHLSICLILFSPEIASKVVLPKIYVNEKFGNDVIRRISDERKYMLGDVSTFANKYTEEEIAKLYLWIELRYPHKNDPVHQGVYTPDYRDNIVRFRSGLIMNLRDRGTFEACRQLEHISQKFPETDWIKWIMVDAKENALRNTWVPVMPEQLLSILNRNALYIVRNGKDLQEVVIKWLEKFQEELQGETYAAPDLWNTEDSWKPKDENNFSDYIKRHMEKDLRNFGIAALREVEIRRGKLGGNKGEETDIYVMATIPGDFPEQKKQIVVIIESKGCWNRELLTAMEEQLANRYLKDNQCKHGIYLVGWFGCPQCEKTNCKTRQCKSSVDDLKGVLKEQAAQLSKPGFDIREFILDVSLR